MSTGAVEVYRAILNQALGGEKATLPPGNSTALGTATVGTVLMRGSGRGMGKRVGASVHRTGDGQNTRTSVVLPSGEGRQGISWGSLAKLLGQTELGGSLGHLSTPSPWGGGAFGGWRQRGKKHPPPPFRKRGPKNPPPPQGSTEVCGEWGKLCELTSGLN